MARTPKIPPLPVIGTIESLSPEGRGIARIEGKVTFIANALPTETVQFVYQERHKDYDVGRLEHIIHPAPQRIEPQCTHFAYCGGCSLQPLPNQAQIEHKQQALQQQLQHLGKVTPETWLPPLTALPWGYRRKARLGVKYVIKKQQLLVGFRERYKPYIADIHTCPILHPQIGYLLPALRQLIAGLSNAAQVPQIEVAMGDQQCVLIIRHLTPFTPLDKERLTDFAQRHNLCFYLQPGNEHSLHPLSQAAQLSYQLPAYNLSLQFEPLDFTQVNSEINRRMIDQAMALLDPQPDDQVLDLFCGMGNFTLPIATRARQVIGVEGNARAVTRAQANARHNRLNHCEFYTADLSRLTPNSAWQTLPYSKILLDPPRTGALEVITQLPLHADRIVYISCYPATLARDAHTLIHQHGYRLSHIGVMDMFPHTAHVESMALFVK